MVKNVFWIEPKEKQPGVRILSKLLLLASLLVLLWPTPGLAQESQIFRLVTFSSAGDSRLGATQGEGQADIEACRGAQPCAHKSLFVNEL